MMKKENGKGMQFRPSVLVECFEEQLGEGLIDEAHMEGLVMQKCSGQDIYCSNAFMVATNKTTDVVTEKYHRIQDKVFFHAFATICRDPNFCTEQSCKINDATAAEFILEQEIKELDTYKKINVI